MGRTSTIKRNATITLAIGSLVVPLNRANADSPAVVVAAGISAEGAILAAGAAGIGAILAGGVIAIGAVAVVVAGSGDTQEAGGETEGGEVSAPGPGGGEQQQRTMGERELPAIVREFVDRDIIISASSLPVPSSDNRKVFAGAVNYKFDGDIRESKPEIRRFSLKDQLILRLTISDIKKPESAPLAFKVDELRLSTVNVPNTSGFSKIQFSAVQEGNVLWRWQAQVNQGELPKIEGPPGIADAVVRRESDVLVIRDLRIPIKYKAPGTGANTAVEVIVNVEGEGART